MKSDRVVQLEHQPTLCEDDIERLKGLLKTAKERFDEKLIELRAEIKKDDSQGDIFSGAVDAEADVVDEGTSDGPRLIPQTVEE